MDAIVWVEVRMVIRQNVEKTDPSLIYTRTEVFLMEPAMGRPRDMTRAALVATLTTRRPKLVLGSKPTSKI